MGILGGTFDPIHFGHLRTAQEVGHAMGMEKVFLIPAASPPHKSGEPVTAFRHRLAMARLGVEPSDILEVLDLEGRRAGPSYSLDTLRQLKSQFGPTADICFMLGSDAFLDIRTWKGYEKLFDYAHFVLIPRPGYDIETLRDFIFALDASMEQTGEKDIYTMPSGNRVIICKSTLIDISATNIRRLAGSGQSITFLVPEAVRNYILEKGLYRAHGKS
ncbi:MAG: nicotinate-nucleotide adenylyltransferase [Desulfatiglandaceae bacterium]|jgi:nicotinate-nucleotide adenylyltransferase